MTPARGVDRVVTLALLALGALNVIITAVTYFDLAGLANQAFSLLGIPGEFTNVESAQLWGPIAAVALIAGFVLTAFLAWRSLRAGRISWWIPVVGVDPDVHRRLRLHRHPASRRSCLHGVRHDALLTRAGDTRGTGVAVLPLGAGPI